jgi:hypothetical protein
MMQIEDKTGILQEISGGSNYNLYKGQLLVQIVSELLTSK